MSGGRSADSASEAPLELPAELSQAGGLRSATIRGSVWTAGSRLTQQIIQLGITVVLARLVLPREFGLIAMIAVFTGFAALFVDAGFGAAVVQRKDLTAAHLSTAFWLNLAAGVALVALAAAAAPLVALFYGQPRLEVIMPVAALNFVLTSLTVVQTALLERRMMFRRIALIENATLIVAGAAAVACAFAGLGVWSLVVYALASSGSQSCLLWVLSDWRPTRTITRAAFRDLWGFGGNLLGSSAINYWNRNFDNLLVGRFVGASELGLYTRAYTLMMLPLTQVSYVAGRTLFPALSRLQDDHERLRRAYLRSVGVIAFITFPIATGLYVVARPLVLTLLGAEWAGVIPFLQILSIAAVIQSIAATTGVVFQASGRTDWELRWQVISGAGSFVFFGVGVHWGAKGVAVAVAARSIVLLYPAFEIPCRLIGLGFIDIVRTVWRILVLALLAAAAAWASDRVLGAGTSAMRLVLEVTVGAVVYIVAGHVWGLEPYRELRASLIRRRAPRSAASVAVRDG